jgi:hypothetical protein
MAIPLELPSGPSGAFCKQLFRASIPMGPTAPSASIAVAQHWASAIVKSAVGQLHPWGPLHAKQKWKPIQQDNTKLGEFKKLIF